MDFDRAAAAWDGPRRIERAKVLAEAIRKSWGEKPRDVLDFGCGTGLLTFALSPFAGRIYGFDTSVEMRKIFEEKTALSKTGNVYFIDADELKNHTFDVIFSSMVFHHIVDVQTQIAALKKQLAPGGLFIWIDLYEDDGSFHQNEPDFNGHNGFSEAEVEKTLKNCGFANVSVRPVFSAERPVDGKLIPYSLFLARAKGQIELTEVWHDDQ
ncbi:MAG TPA: methyltransferase domain-containing protein [Oscillospiraceae bacterium]|nr:methyltransferase domain-containing protein [Oscillospiraceae bacterium]HPF55707.1 methyltransferase domain-containing protein [Clostridiales bacterium]HPK35548.1 methyltransferase domain-containing protein [Oscillospiraceae bacterium]HPR75910.1 methyltransferase domain-containing protein [Oscillospiraceae bacterium]